MVDRGRGVDERPGPLDDGRRSRPPRRARRAGRGPWPARCRRRTAAAAQQRREQRRGELALDPSRAARPVSPPTMTSVPARRQHRAQPADRAGCRRCRSPRRTAPAGGRRTGGRRPGRRATTSSAPRPRTKSTLAIPHTASTRAPACRASWTAKLPTPPEAPTTSTRSPGRTPPTSCTACIAVTPDSGTAAASSKLPPRGLADQPVDRRDGELGVGAGGDVPTTSSPTAKPRDALARPRPRHRRARARAPAAFGRRTPNASRTSRGSPVHQVPQRRGRRRPPGPPPGPRRRPGTGSGRSSIATCSVPPYSCRTIAFMAVPPLTL